MIIDEEWNRIRLQNLAIKTAVRFERSSMMLADVEKKFTIKGLIGIEKSQRLFIVS